MTVLTAAATSGSDALGSNGARLAAGEGVATSGAGPGSRPRHPASAITTADAPMSRPRSLVMRAKYASTARKVTKDTATTIHRRGRGGRRGLGRRLEPRRGAQSLCVVRALRGEVSLSGGQSTRAARRVGLLGLAPQEPRNFEACC